MRKSKKIALWAAGILTGSCVLLILAIQIFGTRILNSIPVKSRIEALLSKEIGVNITLGKLDVSLFPRVSAGVSRAALSAPGTAEGTIESFRIYARLFPLFLGNLRIEEVQAVAPDFTIQLSRGPVPSKTAVTKKTTFTETMETVLGPLVGPILSAPGLVLDITKGRLDLVERGRSLFLIQNINARFLFAALGSEQTPYRELAPASEMREHASRSHPSTGGYQETAPVRASVLTLPPAAGKAYAATSPWRFRLICSVAGLDADSPLLPGRAGIKGGTFEVLHDRLSFSDVRLEIAATSLQLSGSIHGYQDTIDALELSADGAMDPKVIRWITTLAGIQRDVKFLPSLTLDRVRFAMDKKDELIAFQGTVTSGDGATLVADLSNSMAGLNIRRVSVKDKASDATLSLNVQNRVLEFAFNGKIAKTTLDRLVSLRQFPNGEVRGNFRARVPLDQPGQSTARGTLRGTNFFFPSVLSLPLHFERIFLNAENNVVFVETELHALGKSRRLSGRGTIDLSGQDIRLDLDLSADMLDLNIIGKKTGADGAGPAGREGAGKPEQVPGPPVSGTVRLRAKQAVYQQYAIKPLYADITLGRDGLRIDLPKAVVCGVTARGHFSLRNGDADLDLAVTAEHEPIQPMVYCFWNRETRITGTARLQGRVAAKGRSDAVLRNLRGTIDVAAVNGRIDYAKGLTRVLEFLNVTEVFRGKFQDMRKEGLGYNSLTVKAHFGKGKLVIDESSLDGVTMDMAANGSFDIDRREIDAVLLVSPIKTGNVVVRAIPIIRDIFGGTLVTIPVKVTGSLDDPQVTYHPVKEVGAGLAGLMKRTLQAPFKLINPDKPGSGEEQTVN